MLFRQSLQHLAAKHSALVSPCRPHIISMTVRWASVNTTMHSQPTTALSWNSTVNPMANDNLTAYLATLRPFSAPPAPTLQQYIQSPLVVEEGMQLTSTLRKRRLKMNKHKHKKLRKRTRALRKRLGK